MGGYGRPHRPTVSHLGHALIAGGMEASHKFPGISYIPPPQGGPTTPLLVWHPRCLPDWYEGILLVPRLFSTSLIHATPPGHILLIGHVGQPHGGGTPWDSLILHPVWLKSPSCLPVWNPSRMTTIVVIAPP